MVLYFGQDLLIYQNNLDYIYEEYPEENQEGKRNPGEKNMSYDDIIVTTEDGVKLAGWFIHHNAKTLKHPTVIYMSETWGNIGYRLEWCKNIYHNLGVNIVLVGYRGYGHSEGSPSEHGLEKDSKAMIDWAVQNPKIDNSEIYLFGNVLGGAVAIYGAQFYQDNLAGLILQNTFSSMAEMVDDTNWLFRLLRPLILANYWPSDERIKTITTPMLFISGTADNMVTTDDMKRLYDAANSTRYKDFLEVPNGGNKDTWRIGGKSYLLAIDEFIMKTRAKKPIVSTRLG